MALGGPVLEEVEVDPLARCVAAARAEAGLDEVPEPRAALPPSDRVAIVVGVPCHRGEEIPPLAYSTRDAARMAEVLEQAGYTVEPLLTVVDRAELDAAIDRAEAALRPGGSLVVYFSGHGVLREEAGRLSRYLVFSDTDLAAIRGTGLSVVTLDERISRIDARSRVVVQDTCFAARAGGKSLGAPVHGGRAKGLPLPEPPLQLRPGDLRLYASRFFEQAIESPEHRGSVYTHHLLAALSSREADLDGDGCVGLLEAHTHARGATEREREGFQTPQLRAREADNLVLGCQAGAPTRAVIRPPEDESWSLEVRDPDGTLVVRDAGTVAPGRYRVQAGRLVDTPDGELTRETLLDASLRLEAGQWLDVEEEVASRGAYTLLEAAGGWRGDGSLPAVSGGLGLWWAERDGGRGRLALGLDGRYGSLQLPDGRVGAVEVHAKAGWWWSLPLGPLSLGGGPQLGLGPSLVFPEGNTPLPGWGAQPGARLHLAGDRVALGVEGGVLIQPRVRDDKVQTDVLPSLRIALGVRL